MSFVTAPSLVLAVNMPMLLIQRYISLYIDCHFKIVCRDDFTFVAELPAMVFVAALASFSKLLGFRIMSPWS